MYPLEHYMAYPVWRRASKKVYVYYHDRNTHKLRQVSRKLTKSLDGLPEEEVWEWVRKWEAEHGIARDRSERIHLAETDRLAILWAQYQSHRNLNRDRRQITSEQEDREFRVFVAQFFVGDHQRKDPKDWYPLIADFHTYLFNRQLSAQTVKRILWMLERFGKYLVFKRHLEYPFVVDIPARKNARVTPLKVRKTPEEILAFVRGAKFDGTPINFHLAILLGYFGALGPGELFALSKEDLLTGGSAEANTKTLSGFRKHKLGSKLSVVVGKTLPIKGKNATIPFTKNDYRKGVVNIWSVEAAKDIAKLVKDLPEGRLFPHSYGHMILSWRKFVMPQLRVTPHDLRRASGLYLGRTLRIDLTLLQEHMRHAEIETTLLYTREPSVPEVENVSKQDFDDVA